MTMVYCLISKKSIFAGIAFFFNFNDFERAISGIPIPWPLVKTIDNPLVPFEMLKRFVTRAV